MMVVLGLGSNIGNRAAYLQTAIQRLAGMVGDIRTSRVLESAAMLPAGAPEGWDMPFLNMAVSGITELSALELLQQLKAIERDMGRRSDACVWSPREIDIDILAMGDLDMQSEALSIPHRGLLLRDFALLPLADVAPDWRYPVRSAYWGQKPADIARSKGLHLSETLRDTGIKLHG